ncbi:MAG: hypothetical protein H0U89_09010 [Acidimicrobiia bacterium]|nr:hypothetical protein [Acidimicrobiia bacterium]
MATRADQLEPAAGAAPGVQPGPGPGEDWAASAADTIERAVSSVRAKTADPLERIVRLVVYGLLAAVVGMAAAVLAVVALVRGLVELLDVVWEPKVWVVDLVLGGIFVLVGLFTWRKRTAKTVKT